MALVKLNSNVAFERHNNKNKKQKQKQNIPYEFILRNKKQEKLKDF